MSAEASLPSTGPKPKTALILIGVLTAIVGMLLSVSPPPFGDLEEQVGLRMLFRLRGSRPVPPDIVVVALDRNTADKLGVPHQPDKWPRSIHAELIRALQTRGAPLIVFNVLFREEHIPVQDAMLAKAIEDHGRVILASKLKSSPIKLERGETPEPGETALELTYDQPVLPMPSLARRALAYAPMTLPMGQVPVRQFQAVTETDSRVLSLPLVALYARTLGYAAKPLWHVLMRVFPEMAGDGFSTSAELASDRGLHEFMPYIIKRLQSSPERIAKLKHEATEMHMKDDERRLILAWIDALLPQPSLFLNPYGPPGSFPTISASRLLGHDAREGPNLSKSVVFVGYADDLQSESRQGFYSVFSNGGENTLSVAELAATAYADLLDRSTVTPDMAYWFVLLWPIPATLVLIGLEKGRQGFALITALWLGYAVFSYHRFSAEVRWIPSFIPLLLQAPLLLSGFAIYQHRLVQEDRQRLQENNQRQRDVVRQQVPEALIDWVLERRLPGVDQFAISIESGVGMCIDIKGSTKLGFSLNPEADMILDDLYHRDQNPVVLQHGGVIVDRRGDSKVFVWLDNREHLAQCTAACRCALALIEQNAAFQVEHRVEKSIRIGLDVGSFILGTVDAVGIVNNFGLRGGTIGAQSSRVENANKTLGTRILVTGAVAEGLLGFCLRRLGNNFQLQDIPGVQALYELMGPESLRNMGADLLIERFAQALDYFESNQLIEAYEAFGDLLRLYPEDGPSAYYLKICQYLLENGIDSRNTPLEIKKT